MDVLLNEEERMIVESAREFLEGECSTDLVRAIETDPAGYSKELWQKCVDMGWPGLSLPEAYGGQDLPLTYLGLIIQEVGRALAPVPLLTCAVSAHVLARHGAEALCQSVIPKIIDGSCIMTFAVQESDPRLCADAIKIKATLDGDAYVLNGEKYFVDNVPCSDLMLVACRTAEKSEGNEGISLFVVDSKAPGVHYTPLTSLAKDAHGKVRFENVRVPSNKLVSDLNHGWPVVQELLDLGAVLISLQILGATRMDTEMGIEYSKYREAFGQPIGGFQSIQHTVADMIIWIDGGELLSYEALWKIDNNMSAWVEVSQAKAFVSEKCQAAVRNSQSIHGGIGFMMEFDLHLWLRRVNAWTMRLGTSLEHRARIAGALLDRPVLVRLGDDITVPLDQ